MLKKSTNAGGDVLPYAVTIFLSAFLLFQIEPVIAKIILPWFGGSAAVWTTCLLFFQVVLLLGYAYAHVLIRLSAARWYVRAHISLLVASLLLLPVMPRAAWKPSGAEEPTARILVLLATTVGLPYLLLSATSPLLQAWYNRRLGGAVPYRLYALSNIGSMLALISYPFVVEPAIEVRTQAMVWSMLYAGFVFLCSSVAIVSEASPGSYSTPAARAVGPPWKQQMLWVALAACASTLLLAVTNLLTQNVAAVPLLWVLPLALYLLSFILCFGDWGCYRRAVWLPLTAAALAGMAYANSGDRQMLSVAVSLRLYLAGTFCCYMTLHGELVRFKPDPQHLTAFYLMCSLGGAGGGIFVGVVAPHVFHRYSEMPISLVWCAFLIYVVLGLDRTGRAPNHRQSNLLWAVSLAGTVALAFYLAPRAPAAEKRFAARNFYGVLDVSDSTSSGKTYTLRTLTNGIINHGNQAVDPVMRLRPTTYYGESTGVGLTLKECEGIPGRRVGIIGLGVGTLAAYGRTGDRFWFYEINPLVILAARQHFTYLQDSKAGIDLVLGDARLSLEREPRHNFDVLVVDAFTSDAIPVHLLTREAFELYFSHLKDSGVLAVHVTNGHLDLAPIVRMSADSPGRRSMVIHSADNPSMDVSAATWVLISARRGFFENSAIHRAATAIARRDSLRTWTDGYSSLWEILK